jgi:ADP-heptose:LPS heptosyltransferase
LLANFSRRCRNRLSRYIPGSGSHEKNWPLENWIGLFSPDSRFADLNACVVISGEADEAQTDQLEREWKNRDVRFARNLPLPRLAAVLERSIFIGHDSGISHLAAAAGANCILLFGPTDPDVWAPRTRTYEFSGRRAGDLMISKSRRLKQLSPPHCSC